MSNSVADNELAWLREVLKVPDGGLTDLRASFYQKVLSGEIVLGSAPTTDSVLVRVDYVGGIGWPNPLPTLNPGQMWDFHSEGNPEAPTPPATVDRSLWSPDKDSAIYSTV